MTRSMEELEFSRTVEKKAVMFVSRRDRAGEDDVTATSTADARSMSTTGLRATTSNLLIHLDLGRIP